MALGPRRLSRRRLLTLLTAAGAAACSRRGRPPEPETPLEATSSTPARAAADGTPPATDPRPPFNAPPQPVDALPQPPPYEPAVGEVFPNAKRTAGRLVQALATYPADQAWERTVAAALDGSGGETDLADLAETAAPLHRPATASAGAVVYAQLGGLDPPDGSDRASVLVVLRQLVGLPEGQLIHTRTLDVRVRLVDGVWVLEGLGDVGGEPLPRPASLPAAAGAVLDHPRIDLPASARWDVHAGGVDERLLEVMLAMAEEYPYSVTCLRSGHPLSVFGTARPSNHAAGRAVDVWAIDGVPVIAQSSEGSPAHRLTRALFDAGVPEVGSPWAFDGYGGRSFTNTVHRDHLHVAFDAR